MRVDAQIHIWQADCAERPWPRAGAEGRTAHAQRDNPMTAEEALAAMNLTGVHRAILVPPSWEGDRNDLALAAAASHPDRFAVMGRIAADQKSLVGWREQPGMLGVRLILGNEDASHWLWAEAAKQNIPVMVAPAGKVPQLARIAQRHPDLRLIVDHLGARVHKTGAAAFTQIEDVVAMAALPNVAIKATCLPGYSAQNLPCLWRRANLLGIGSQPPSLPLFHAGALLSR